MLNVNTLNGVMKLNRFLYYISNKAILKERSNEEDTFEVLIIKEM